MGQLFISMTSTRPDYNEKYVNKVVLITFWADRNSSAGILRHFQELAANREVCW